MPATHGWWCGAKTWPTKCPSCSQPVFFFQCDCGSKVFFDKLGEPWPVHDCDTAWARSLKRKRGPSGSVTVEIAEGITAYRPPEGPISVEVVSQAKRRQIQRDPIVAVPPSTGRERVHVTGVVRELRKDVDVIESLKLPDSPMTTALLGPLGKGRWGRVTIHAPSSKGDVLHSYTAWIMHEELSNPKHSKGITVEADLHGYSVPGKDAVMWVCDEYRIFSAVLDKNPL